MRIDFVNTKNCFVTAQEAFEKLSYRECYFSQLGLGDTLIFLSAAEIYYKKYNKKLLLIVRHLDFFENCDFCNVIKDIEYDKIQDYIDFKNDTININGFIFKITFVCIDDYKKYKSTDFFVSSLPTQKTMLGSICERLGVEGNIPIDPKIYLTEEEKKFGKYFENQVAIISAGVSENKSINNETVQKLVENLKDKYNFVHIGLKSDPEIKNALDLRGGGTTKLKANSFYSI